MKHLKFKLCLLLSWWLLIPAIVSGSPVYEPVTITPPAVSREFRGVWISGVGDSAWETNATTTAAQKTALIAILDRAQGMKLNAVLFQVRPSCDAFYDSKIEPWSEFLTGKMGKPPEPYYDPLAFVVEEAHKRGLEVHAWFNPYRALHFSSKSAIATNHVCKAHPQWVRKYGQNLWLDPGERDVQDYTLSVVMDVVKRYDVDGVVFDDYFYPYPEKRADGKYEDFPDYVTWKKYGVQTGLGREDWRRENVNSLVQRTYSSIKAVKSWVKFGVSPFGIWRPGNPAPIKGLDAYSSLYADSRKWLANGWVDYLAPQLYWPIDDKEHSFTALLPWWAEQNVKGRHLWPGLNTYKVLEGWQPEEIKAQIEASRRQRGVDGVVHWNSKVLMTNRRMAQTLTFEVYPQPALIPASPWLGTSIPQRPTLTISGNLDVRWSAAPGDMPRWWLLQLRYGNTWRAFVMTDTGKTLDGAPPDVITVTAVDRNGNAGPTAVMGRKADALPPGTSVK